MTSQCKKQDEKQYARYGTREYSGWFAFQAGEVMRTSTRPTLNRQTCLIENKHSTDVESTTVSALLSEHSP